MKPEIKAAIENTVMRDLARAKRIKIKVKDFCQCQYCGKHLTSMWVFYDEAACSKDCMKILLLETAVNNYREMQEMGAV